MPDPLSRLQMARDDVQKRPFGRRAPQLQRLWTIDGHIIWFGAVLLLYLLFQMHSYAFACLFPNSRTNVRLDGQHVLSVAHSHK